MSLGKKESGSRLCRKPLPGKGWIITFLPPNSPDPLLPSSPSPSHVLLVRVRQPRCGREDGRGSSVLSILPGEKPGKTGKTGRCCLKVRAEAEPGLPWGMGEGECCQRKAESGAGFSGESVPFLLVERLKLLSYLSPDSSSKDIAQSQAAAVRNM